VPKIPLWGWEVARLSPEEVREWLDRAVSQISERKSTTQWPRRRTLVFPWKRRVIIVPIASSAIGSLIPYLLLSLQPLFSASDGARRSFGGIVVALAPFAWLAALGQQWEFERDLPMAAFLNAGLYAVAGLLAVFVACRGKVLRWTAVAFMWIVVATWLGAGWAV